MKEKLKIEHLAPYLPYKLRIKYFNRNIVMNAGSGSSKNWIGITAIMQRHNIENCMPILRLISDITKEIEHNGQRLIVADIIFPKNDYSCEFNRQLDIESLKIQNAIEHSCTYYSVVQILLMYHFDVFGLIDKGQAINISTIK